MDGGGCPVESILAAVPWGVYLGAEALENGVDAQVSKVGATASKHTHRVGQDRANTSIARASSWRPRTTASTKASLDVNGYVSEGSGENIFVIYKGDIYNAAAGQQHPRRHHATARFTIARPGLHRHRG
ncbi:MAG: hypothetical protein R2838_15465 [Caldilineaceae bacterium]